MLPLYLASQSPRRRMILKNAGYSFQVLPIEVSEILDENLNFAEQIQQVSETKAKAAIKKAKCLELQNILILTADTGVGFEGRTLGKPKNSKEAEDTLRQLSGRTHHVCTAFTLWHSASDVMVSGHELTEITFHELSPEDIKAYVATGSSMDKAGSYGLQDVEGDFVKLVDGCRWNVIGLPITKFQKVLKENSWSIR